MTLRSRLWALLIAQFAGAFNDNAWKLMVAMLAIHATGVAEGPSKSLQMIAQQQTTVAFVTFTLPLILFSFVAGTVADRFSKRTVLIALKGLEVVLLAGATAALLVQPTGGWIALVILAGMGMHSALFSPAKYGILPELVPHQQLTMANGWLELTTFLAIIFGTYMGGLLLSLSGNAPWAAAGALTTVAFIGLAAAFWIPQVPAARQEGGVIMTMQSAWRSIRRERSLLLAIAGLVLFWTIASLFSQDVLVYARTNLGFPDHLTGLPLAVLSLGIGIGAVTAGRLSRDKVEYGLIPLGALALSIFLFVLGLLPSSVSFSFVLMVLLGGASGLMVVPINALVQSRTDDATRGGVLALSNAFIFTGVMLGSLGAALLSSLGFSTEQIFIACALITGIGTVWALWLLPEAFLQLLFVLATRTVYRLTVQGIAHVPNKGAALIIPNHVSFVDGFLLLAAVDRPIRFLVDAAYANHPLLAPLMRLAGVIPISTSEGPRVVLRAMRRAGQYLDQGELVCIFAEGQITRIGVTLPFRRGYERLLKGRQVPILPVHLDRVWGSIFSFAGGTVGLKWPSRVPYPVTVSFGGPLPAGTPPHAVREAVQELGEAAWTVRTPERPPLHYTAIHALRRHPFRLAVADGIAGQLSALKTLAGAIALGRALRTKWRDQPRVGILLPPSVAAVLANLSAALAGRVAVNLNYTVGPAGLASAVAQAGLRTVVTSHQFVDKLALVLPGDLTPIWLEELRPRIGTWQRIAALFCAAGAPIRFIERYCGAARTPRVEDLVTIIFSSGSTGDPKGVMLSHANIDANVEAVAQVFPIRRDDRILGILPHFHSFGYMATLWLALNHGMGVILHPTPLEPAAVSALTRRYRVTYLIVTPTFLQLYLRRCTAQDFGSLRTVMTGAEKLSDRLALAFEEKFGIRPLEGYGATECAPVIAVNVPGFRAPGLYQAGARRGHVGRPLPGVTVRIVDPETCEPLPLGQSGMVVVRGRNVMVGYLGQPALTAQVIRDGWYVTGDIGMMDEEGFLQITDRLSRFSKIGGEMVPHGRVEQALQEAAGGETPQFAVTAIADDKKGERLMVLTTVKNEDIAGVLESLARSGLPNLFIPRKDQFITVDKLPVLGTGKLDLREMKRIAVAAATTSGATDTK